MLIVTITATIVVIGVLVLVHELGHFVTAKAVGMRVHEFALGFGPKLVSKQYGETLYSLRCVPLGGFNKIAGMEPDEEQDERSFNAKPIWARMLVIVAGPVMNFILPLLLFAAIGFFAGIDISSDKPVISSVLPDSPALHAGLQPGDRLLAVNGTPIASFRQFAVIIHANAGNKVILSYQRDGQRHELAITPMLDSNSHHGIIGVAPEVTTYHPGLGEAFALSGKQVYILASGMLTTIGQMISGKAPADLAGPLGVAKITGEVAMLGFLPLLKLTAILSLNLGLINLLPVPVLDGGHLVTLAVEGVRRKPLSPQKMQVIQIIGFTLLITLMLWATFKDLTRFFTKTV